MFAVASQFGVILCILLPTSRYLLRNAAILITHSFSHQVNRLLICSRSLFKKNPKYKYINLAVKEKIMKKTVCLHKQAAIGIA